MRTSARSLCHLLLAASAVAAASEDKSAALRARLQSAAAQSSLDTQGLAPWHLKLDVQLFDNTGDPKEKGTIESWWTGPTNIQTRYTFPSYTATEVLSPTGLRRSKLAGLPPNLMNILLRQVIHPAPDLADVDQSVPDLRKQTIAQVPLECIMLDQRIVGAPFPPFGLFPTFCFDPGKDFLRLSFNLGSELILRNAIGTFQGRHVATSITINENAKSAATGHIATLEARANLEAPPLDEASLEAPPKVPSIPAETVAGMIVSRPNPVYPQSAKDRHVAGTVIVRAIIGRDGHVRSIRLVQVPDADLAIAAVAAVRHWVYKPYLLNGEPTEVDTTITVRFTFGPG